jgi:hypothetical protein
MLPATQAPSLEEADWMLFYEDVPRDALAAAVARDGRFIVPDPENDPDRVIVELDSDRPGGEELVR